MDKNIEPELYRNFIDHMVNECHNGQGQISANRFLEGMWNRNASAEFLQDQHEINLLLQRLSLADRTIIGKLLCTSFEDGVFETMKALEEFEVPPFTSGNEGSPYHDFIGRLDNWEWP